MNYSNHQQPPPHLDPSWMYTQQQQQQSVNISQNEPLREPVPFEDFQFSFGLDPGFSIPIPLDMPPVPSHDITPMDCQSTVSHPPPPPDNIPLLDENDQKAFSQFLDAFFVDNDGQMTNAETMANQFSSLYDSQPPPLSLNDTYPPPPPPTSELTSFQIAANMFLPKQRQTRPPPPPTHHHHQDMDDDEYRRSSILQSLDQQKQFHQRLNRIATAQQAIKSTPSSSSSSAPSTNQLSYHLTHPPLPLSSSTNTIGHTSPPSSSSSPSTSIPSSSSPSDPHFSNAIFLQQSNQVSAPYISKQLASSNQRYHPTPSVSPYPTPERQHSPTNDHYNNNNINNINNNINNNTKGYRASQKSSSSTTTRRNRSHKELLTEEEKRSNHIASEQKRRSTIRNGFKDLTEIVPTLKNINNSKSTVLFKAVDYIKYLEKRTKSLRDKAESLEMRVKVEGRVSDILMHTSSLQSSTAANAHMNTAASSSSSSSSPSLSKPSLISSSSSNNYNNKIHPETTPSSKEINVKQEIKEKENDDDNMSSGVTAALLVHQTQQKQLLALQEQLQYHQRLLAQQQDHPHHPSHHHHHHHQSQQHYSSSSNSSSANSSPQSSDLYQHPPVPSARWMYEPTSKSTTNKDVLRSHVSMDVDNEAPLKISA
ncbi:hypothetical protein BJ944DRAFT_183672 [Cunninghamella echinulata]|nr:hypothetical protein BJ944DRAFT_183672 [Cunninghamella echinulata]